ncbi:PREDICTED: myosin-binding protein 3-like [Camelina sativa]|uniref:Myosin-binding protein 3-like n=1 Tax=Camelina sativa TaxID=90675 RepID=A0ABM0T3J7_CAMSA|nr:PREDICTED: myosin-binding protein 3-like [Camelina sativa]
MAANNFATKLSRNTNRITVILVYAFLEWLLMFFIFLNSLFTYFIVRFASFFGLKQVCLLCPNLDRLLERNSANRFTYYREVLCENHVAELATLSFCRTHGKTSESANLCSDCSNREEERSNIGLGFCTCCQKSLAEKPYPNYLLIKSSIWGKTLGVDRENGGLILEMIDDDKFFGDGFEVEREDYPLGPFFRGKAEEEEGKRQELHQNGEVISDVESYGLSLREVSEEDGLRSIISNINSPGNEEEIPEAKSRVSEDEQRDDDTGNVETHGEGQISVPVAVKEEEGADLLVDQFESKNFTGSQNQEEGEEDGEDKNKELDPETPTSVSTSLFNKKLLFLARNEYAGDESVLVSEMDDGGPLKTIERLRETMRAEQEALRDLYAELEEERSASAISANQTMAMITRLQEEKAKVQMEALQYQRMMEEQAEYDQEALQLLNHLMVKREKEKEQLQRELDVYREKVLEYESKATNKITITKTNSEASDDGSNDDDGKKEENGEEDTSSETDVDLEKITLDCVQHMSILGESLSEFEEERLVILDQLRVLEDRLVTMQDNDQSAEDPKFPGEFSNSYDQEESYSEHEGQTMASMAKSLLPLLDAAENESEDEYQELPESAEKNFGSESEKLEIIKQVDSVYERLQVLETDGEFLKNCMSSAKKGDKGTDILKDILQHLRDLRTIELTDTIENQTTQED